MSTLPLLFKGFGIGLAIAAPVGPIGVLCIRRTLNDGMRIGLVSGLGAACADAVYGAIAAFGISAVAMALLDLEFALRVVGGLFLLALGARILLRAPATAPADAPHGGLRFAGAFGSSFVLTLTNPTTILSFIAIFAGLGLVGHAGDRGAAASLVAGVFAGSALWWLLLSGTVGLLRNRLGPTALIWINRLSGIIIAGFGIGALVGAVWRP